MVKLDGAKHLFTFLMNLGLKVLLLSLVCAFGHFTIGDSAHLEFSSHVGYPSVLSWWGPQRSPQTKMSVFSQPVGNDLEIRGQSRQIEESLETDEYPIRPPGGAERSVYSDDNEKAAAYEEVMLDEMEYDGFDDCYYYPCPCGDRFVLTSAEYAAGCRIAPCPSCSLVIRIK